MTREAKIMAGIILITVPSIRYGGYFLLTQLMDRSSGYMDNPLRRNFSRAGHAHVGVIVILSLVCQVLADAGHAAGADYVAGASGRAAGCDPDSPGLFPVGDGRRRRAGLIYVGAAVLASSVVTLGGRGC